MERRLAAILSVDMVGYSRLMGEDEVGTIARQKTHRSKFLDPKIAEFGGRIVKTTGDGLLVEFPSAVAATQCAAEIQRSIAEVETRLSDDKRIRYRIGINIGDIIVEDDDIYGDGVNLAARLQELAEPEGIYLARNVFNQVANKVDLHFSDLGTHSLKNIAEPINVYKVQFDDDAKPTKIQPRKRRLSYPMLLAGAAVVGAALGLAIWTNNVGIMQPQLASIQASEDESREPGQPTLAILPFNNLSKDRELDYVSNGVTEDIITGLSRSPALLVIAYNSSLFYKGKTKNIEQIAAELGVQYVLEGSLRRRGDNLRITAQLIDARTGKHLWAELYDDDNSDVYAAVDRVTGKIVNSIGGREGRIHQVAYRESWGKDAASLDEYDYLVRGHFFHNRFTKNDMARAVQIWQTGLSRYPQSGLMKIKLGWGHLQQARFGWVQDTRKTVHAAYQLATEGLADQQVGPLARWYGHWLLAYYYVREKDFDRALSEFKTTLDLAPYDADTRASTCQALIYAGKPEECIKNVAIALRRNPFAPWWYYRYAGWAHYMKGDYEEAIRILRKVSKFDLAKNRVLAASYVRVDRLADAQREVSEIMDRYPGMSLDRLRQIVPYVNQEHLEIELQDLHKAGLPK